MWIIYQDKEWFGWIISFFPHSYLSEANNLFIPHHRIVAWYLVGCPSHLFVRTSVSFCPCFHFPTITFIPCHRIVVGYDGITLVVLVFIFPFVCLSYIHLSIFCFQTMTWVNISGFSPNLVCALILWRSGFGLIMSKFFHFLCPATKSGKVLCYTIRNFQCSSVRPSVLHNFLSIP